jgi:hypothetical protein
VNVKANGTRLLLSFSLLPKSLLGINLVHLIDFFFFLLINLALIESLIYKLIMQLVPTILLSLRERQGKWHPIIAVLFSSA